MNRCPNCLSQDLIEYVSVNSEPHGDTNSQEYLRCESCGCSFEASDLVSIPEITLDLYPADEIEFG